MSKFNPPQPESESIEQAATRCFVSTVLSVTNGMAEACPSVGIAFQKRWARAPQRIGFEPTAVALESTRQAFERDLSSFFDYTGMYFRNAVPLVKAVAESGAEAADAVLEKVAAHAVLLETLAESLSTIADLDASDSVREALEHRSAGLLKCAGQVESEVLPLVTRLRELIVQCESLVAESRQVPLVDAESGLLNAAGFHRELDRRKEDNGITCMVRLRIGATVRDGAECTDAQFRELAVILAPAILEQFRANDSIALLDRRIGILFDGTPDQARSRRSDIERRLMGKYPVAGAILDVAVEMDVFEPSQDLAFIFASDPEVASVDPAVAEQAVGTSAIFDSACEAASVESQTAEQPVG